MSAIVGRVNVDEFRRLTGKTSELPAKLKRELRAHIRLAAERAADDSRTTIDSGPSKTGLRMGIAAGIRVQVMTGNTAGVRIIADKKALPDSKAKLVRAMDKPSFRHPVFGQKSWVQQAGRPYFASVIYQHRDQVSDEVRAAMQATLDSLKVT